MGVLVDPKTNQTFEFGPEETSAKLQQGWLVPLVNREGNLEAIPYDEGHEYLSTGYSQPNDSQLNHLLDKTHYNSPEQRNLAIGEGVARGLTGPAYDFLAPKTGLTTKEDIQKRHEFHHDAALAADIGTTVVGALTGVGLPGLVGKAGRAAGLAGKLLPGMAGQVTGEVAKGAAEGALYAAASKIDENILGDPKEVSENLMAHIGLGALLGGGASLALAPATKIINRAGNLSERIVDKITAGHAVGKAISHVADLAIDLAPIGVTRPVARITKKAVIDSLLQKLPEAHLPLGQLLHISDLTQKVTDKMQNYAAGIFAKEVDRNIHIKDENEEPVLDKLGTMVQEHAADPEKLIEQMSHNTLTMANIAPEVSSQLTTNVANAVNYLHSKLPISQKESLLDEAHAPPKQDITAFNNYAEVVKNPLHVLQKIKNATILPQDVEALTAVYPVLLQQMRSTVMDKMLGKLTAQKSLQLPYNKRMSLSLFLGTPLDSTLKPQSILSNQHAFGMMTLQRQGHAAAQGMARASKTGMGRMNPLSELTRSQRALNRR